MFEKRLVPILVVVFLGSMIGCLAIGGIDFIEVMGRYIPQENLVWDYVVGFLWATVLGLGILFWPVSARDKRLLLPGWGARIVMAMSLMLFYEYFYDTDSFGYFYNMRELGFQPEQIRLGHGLETVTSLLGLHHEIFPDSYHMLKVNCALIGFISVYLFYRAGALAFGREEPRLFYALALYPSVLLWSSVVGKDPIMLFGISLYAYAVVAWYRTSRLRYLALMALGIVVAMYMRAWMGAILIAPLMVFPFYRARGYLSKAVFAGLVAVALAATAGRGGDKFEVSSAADLLATAQRYRNTQSVGGSRQLIDLQFGDVASVAAFTPLGMFTALFRPLPGEVRNPFGLLAGIENLLLLLLFLRALRRLSRTELREPLVVWAAALVLLWSASYGIISYQNLGAAVRYKLQVLPIMVILLLYLNRPKTQALPKASPSLQRRGVFA